MLLAGCKPRDGVQFLQPIEIRSFATMRSIVPCRCAPGPWRAQFRTPFGSSRCSPRPPPPSKVVGRSSESRPLEGENVGRVPSKRRVAGVLERKSAQIVGDGAHRAAYHARRLRPGSEDFSAAAAALPDRGSVPGAPCEQRRAVEGVPGGRVPRPLMANAACPARLCGAFARVYEDARAIQWLRRSRDFHRGGL